MMEVLEKIAQRSWDFILYRTSEGYVLNVVFSSGMADITRSFRLQEEEAQRDFEGLIALAEEIREGYESFKDREITPTVSSGYS